MLLTACRRCGAFSRHEYVVSARVPINALPLLQAEVVAQEYRDDPPGDCNTMTICAAIEVEQ
ncbi:hypothetical protein ACQPZQ_30810 [Pseudonocardia sp. CA-142604]|uniref:hypothetical protein n=1 Tax=Pseudonocardia sp. CA-142604 TaxID=3240024 RepID=UPI003D8D2928